MASIERRLQILEERANVHMFDTPLAVVDVIGLAQEQAQRQILERERELAAGGYGGPLLILDR
jgi:hypothetical protein